MDKRPIGVMDSGLGGLSVLRVLQKELPAESLVFVGDQGHFPYGTKSQTELQKLVLRIGQFLVHQYNIKTMVIACNTATAAALPLLQSTLPIPVIGVIEPGALAALADHPHTIGVIGTASTIKKGAYERTLHHFADQVRVYSHATQPLVSIVEHGQTGTPLAQETVNQELAYFDAHPVQTLVLGCTHFPFLAPEIQQKMGAEVKLVDPAFETIKQLHALLNEHDLLAPAGHKTVDLLTTGKEADLVSGAQQWLNGEYTSCQHVQLDEEE